LAVSQEVLLSMATMGSGGWVRARLLDCILICIALVHGFTINVELDWIAWVAPPDMKKKPNLKTWVAG
jgi:hypothetical protein